MSCSPGCDVSDDANGRKNKKIIKIQHKRGKKNSADDAAVQCSFNLTDSTTKKAL